MGCDQCDFPNIKIWLRILLSLSALGFFIAGKFLIYVNFIKYFRSYFFYISVLAPLVLTNSLPSLTSQLSPGNIWVYGAWEEVETRKGFLNNDEYCNPWVYWVAFCTITVNTALTLIALFSLMAWCLLACCIKLCCKGVVDETTPLTTARSGSPV